MANFKFRMEPLIKLRKMRQEQAERELSQRLSQMMTHKRQIESLEQQIQNYYQQMRDQHTGEIQISGLIADRRYLNHLHQIRHHQLAAMAKSSQLVDKARRQLAEAKKQTDIMQKLKERMFQRFQKEESRRETILLDDLVNAKAAWMTQKMQTGDEIYEDHI